MGTKSTHEKPSELQDCAAHKRQDGGGAVVHEVPSL